MKKNIFIVLFIVFALSCFGAAQTPYQLKRLTPSDDSVGYTPDTAGNTPDCWTHSFPQSVCDINGKVYVGGDYGFINVVDKATWKINRFIGVDGTRCWLRAGYAGLDINDQNVAIIPDGVTDMKYDPAANRLYMASWWYRNIMVYDFNTNHFDNFSGLMSCQGTALQCVQGGPTDARYGYGEDGLYIDVKGNTVYVSDNYYAIIVGINTVTGYSYIIAGNPNQYPRSIQNGTGLTQNVTFQSPHGIAVNSTNDKIYVADYQCIRCLDIANDSASTVANNVNCYGMVLASDNSTFYYADKDNHMVGRYNINTDTSPTLYGHNGDNYIDPSVTLSNVGFKQPDNIAISVDNKSLYIVDRYNYRVKMIDINGGFNAGSIVTPLHGWGAWYPNTKANYTGWGMPSVGDFYGNTFIVSCADSKVVSKIYSDGIKEDIAGKPGVAGFDDGQPGTSVCNSPISGAVTTWSQQCAETPYYWFFDMGELRRIDLANNNNTVRIAGNGGIFGYGGDFPDAPGNFKIGGTGHLFSYQNFLYFTDTDNHCVRKYDIGANRFYLVAGQPLAGSGHAYGTGLTTYCKLNQPRGITVDKNSGGNILYTLDIGEDGTGRICWIDQTGNSMGVVYSGICSSSNDITYNNMDKIIYVFDCGAMSGEILAVKSGNPEIILGGSVPDNWSYIEMDGNSDTAYVGIPYGMKYYDDKRLLVFDKGIVDSAGRTLYYLDMNGDYTPVPTSTSLPCISPTNSWSPTPTFTVTSYLSPTPTRTWHASCWDGNVVAHYACDSATGGYLIDDVGGYDAVMSGNLIFSKSNKPLVPWALGSCSGQQNGGNYFTLPNPGLNNALAGGAWTIEFYVYLQDAGGAYLHSLFTKGTYSIQTHWLHSDILENPGQPSNGAVRIFAPGVNAQQNSFWDSNAWVQWAYVWDGTYINVYKTIGGITTLVFQQGCQTSAFQNAGDDPLKFLGSWDFGDNPLKGSISEIVISNIARISFPTSCNMSVTATITETHTVTENSTVTPTATDTPARFAMDLKGNFPNPFNDRTDIVYSLSKDAKVDVDVWTISGQMVKHISDIDGKSGDNNVLWYGTNNSGKRMASGVYIYRIHAKTVYGDEAAFVRKMGCVR
jgi:hypothetical protein